MSRTENVSPIFRKDYQAAPFAIDAVNLVVEIWPSHTTVESTLELRRIDSASTDDLVLDGEDLETTSIMVDGQALAADAYSQSAHQLRIPGLPARATLRSVVRLKPQENSELSGFYLSGKTLCTQCEAEGFRRITWFLDRPDVLSRFTVSLCADDATYPVLLSNGNLIAEESLADGRRRVQWQDPHPKPCYLFAMVAGKLDCVAKPFTTASGRVVECEIYVEPGMADRAHYALESLHHSMTWDEQRYGLEYDLDRYMIVAVSTFNMGAMENKGLNIFNDKFVLASDDTATDGDFEGVEGVIAHEYFHNWTGNRVTCRDWFQLTLKEGLTVFRDQQFSADRTSQAVKRIDEVRLLRNFQFPEDSGPMAHPIRPESYVAMDNFYTATVYNKGAEVIRMYHTLLGEAGFRAGMDLYFQRHDGQAVTCDDFRAAMADANQRDFSQFERWYTQPGTPTLHLSTTYDATAQTYTVQARQDLPQIADFPAPQPHHLPIRIGLLDRAGQALALDLGDGQQPYERVLENTEHEQSWTFHGIKAEPVPSLLRDFSAPVRLRYDASFEDLALLARADSDPFNRWQAGQEVARRVIVEQIKALDDGSQPQPSPQLDAVFAATLADDSVDGSLRALALALPSDRELAQEFATVPVEAIHQVRRFHQQHLGKRYATQLRQCYDALAAVAPADRSVLARQQRRLRHACLTYLGQLGGDSLDLATAHYQASGNMTERVAALGVLAQHRDPRRDAAFADFYKRYQGNDLVIDKWFALQASADCPDTIEQVKALREHPDFRLSNPNRVRSLLSALAMGNHPHFHRADGSGYALIGDAVLALAARNPQLAARLVGTLNQWKRYDSKRQDQMREQLQRVKDSKPSRDVMEIVDRALGA